jgi:hypothetical protein
MSQSNDPKIVTSFEDITDLHPRLFAIRMKEFITSATNASANASVREMYNIFRFMFMRAPPVTMFTANLLPTFKATFDIMLPNETKPVNNKKLNKKLLFDSIIKYCESYASHAKINWDETVDLAMTTLNMDKEKDKPHDIPVCLGEFMMKGDETVKERVFLDGYESWRESSKNFWESVPDVPVSEYAEQHKEVVEKTPKKTKGKKRAIASDATTEKTINMTSIDMENGWKVVSDAVMEITRENNKMNRIMKSAIDRDNRFSLLEPLLETMNIDVLNGNINDVQEQVSASDIKMKAAIALMTEMLGHEWAELSAEDAKDMSDQCIESFRARKAKRARIAKESAKEFTKEPAKEVVVEDKAEDMPIVC